MSPILLALLGGLLAMAVLALLVEPPPTWEDVDEDEREGSR